MPIIAEKVHNKKVQQEKLKEVKARINFERCLGRNSKIQETSQYSESRTPNKRGDLRKRLKPRRSRSTSRSPEPTSVFSRIQRDRSASPRRRQGDKRRRERDVFHRLGVEEEVCPHTQKAATRVSVHEERSRSQKVKTVKEDIGSQSRENRSQASKRKIYLNHGHAHPSNPLLQTPQKEPNAKQRIPSELPSTKEVHQISGRDPPHQAERRGIHERFRAKAPSGSEKPNDSSYRTPHWLQWINHMANRTNTAASKNRRYGAFHLYMDEFCGNKITISIQLDHRKARSEEDSNSPVNSSRNAKIPNPRRDIHSLEQQDNPT
nr:hypothetical protein [Tanacetum cinerariifolium]